MNSATIIEFNQVSKRFCRSSVDSVRNASMKAIRHLVRLPPQQTLGVGEFWALRDIDLSVSRGECIGIIGPNGAGKSTLLRLINGDYRPDAGAILRRGRVTSLLRIGNGLHPLLSGRENIYVHLNARGVDKTQADRLLEAIVGTAGLEKAIDRPVKQYSDGMYSRLEFALITAVPLDILLIDEVLSVGDM
ncbi:MAG: ABC transporter ATP-binding protein, partial [Methylococcaceae bacterium]